MSFPKYETYKESGVEWLGEVPEHWNTKKLCFLTEKIGDGIHATPEYVDESSYYFINGNNLIDGCILTNNSTRCVSESEFEKYNLKLGQNTLLLSINGTIGNVAFYNNEKVVLGKSAAYINCDKDLSKSFLYFFLKSESSEKYFFREVTGTTISNLSLKSIRNLVVPVPSQNEQQLVARFLDHETARIDALIAEQERLIELLKEKRQAVISHAVTKGLDSTAPMRDSGVEWLGEVPKHWDVGSLRWYATIQGGIAKGKDYENRKTVTLPYLRVANVQSGFVDLTEVKDISLLETEVERYSLRNGDVLMNEGGDNDKLGRGTVWQGQISPCLHQNHVFAIRPNTKLLPDWLAMFTQSDQARTYFYLNSKQSTNLASISASNVMSLSLPIPSVNEQKKILEYLETDYKKHKELVDVATSTVELLQERRSALISAAVTGKIDVRGKAPASDSPAATLEAAHG